jgi:hypothetical protein
MFIPVVPPPGLAQAFTGRLGELASTQPGSGAGQSEGANQTGGAQHGDGGGQGPGGQPGQVEQPGQWQEDNFPGQGQGSGEPLDATRAVSKGAPGRSTRRISRLLKSKALYISLATVIMAGGGALLLAEEAGQGVNGTMPLTVPTNAKTATVKQTAVEPVTTTSRTATATTTTPTVTSEPEATTSVPAAEESGSEQTPTTPLATPSLVITGGSVTPRALYYRESINYRATIEGQAGSVTARVVDEKGATVENIALVRGIVLDGTENWGVTTTASFYGTCTLHIDAVGAQGQETSYLVGDFRVYAPFG